MINIDIYSFIIKKYTWMNIYIEISHNCKKNVKIEL